MAEMGKIRVALIGAGKFGARRAAAVAAHPRCVLVVVSDAKPEESRCIASQFGCESSADWKRAATGDDVDVVIASTPTHALAEVTRRALDAGKHVLCEKPFGRNAEEVLPLVETARKSNLRLKVGFNLRYHPALQQAHALFREGVIGRALSLRCSYGHGGRPGYEREWRCDPRLSGGGDLLDQGVHALDLFRWFAGEFEEAAAFIATSFWPIAPAEDNVFALLRAPGGCVAQLHASWTHWKNQFLFEICGERGYLAATGLGGNYGAEGLCCGVRPTPGAKPEERRWAFPEADRSLEREWDDFLNCVSEGREPQSNGEDAWRTLCVVDAIYRAAREGRNAKILAAGEPEARVLEAAR